MNYDDIHRLDRGEPHISWQRYNDLLLIEKQYWDLVSDLVTRAQQDLDRFKRGV